MTINKSCFSSVHPLSFSCYFIFLDSSRDAAYVGKILEGFTLASVPVEAKTVRENHHHVTGSLCTMMYFI